MKTGTPLLPPTKRREISRFYSLAELWWIHCGFVSLLVPHRRGWGVRGCLGGMRQSIFTPPNPPCHEFLSNELHSLPHSTVASDIFHQWTSTVQLNPGYNEISFHHSYISHFAISLRTLSLLSARAEMGETPQKSYFRAIFGAYEDSPHPKTA